LAHSFFFLPFDYSFRACPLYIFKIFIFFGNMEPLQHEKDDSLAFPQSIMKYETYWYGRLIVAPPGDGFSR